MSLSKEAREIRQRVNVTDEFISNVIDGTNTTQTIELGIVAQKISVQADGDLTYTIQVSINGENFSSAVITSGSANLQSSYSTNLVSVIQITRTAGSGRVTILAV